jgi:hypothetical protein
MSDCTLFNYTKEDAVEDGAQVEVTEQYKRAWPQSRAERVFITEGVLEAVEKCARNHEIVNLVKKLGGLAEYQLRVNPPKAVPHYYESKTELWGKDPKNDYTLNKIGDLEFIIACSVEPYSLKSEKNEKMLTFMLEEEQ